MQEKAVKIRDILKSKSYTIRATAHAAWACKMRAVSFVMPWAFGQARIAFIITYYVDRLKNQKRNTI